MWAYNMAANNMGIDASVMYYGRFSLEDDLSMMRAHILCHVGEDDTSSKVDDVKQFEAKLTTLAEAATLAWQRTLDFLLEHYNKNKGK